MIESESLVKAQH